MGDKKMIYEIQERLIVREKMPQDEIEYSKARGYIEVISMQEWQKRVGDFLIEEIRDFERIDCSKIIEGIDYLWGSFMIPTKNDVHKRRVFFFIIEKKKVTFIEHEEFVAHILAQIAKVKVWKKPCIESFLYTFLEALIDKDYIYLYEFENKLRKVEDSIVNGGSPNFNHKMMAFRKEIATWHHYYLQLLEIGRKLKENESEFFEEDGMRLFELFNERVINLQGNTKFLREYAIQIREVYQTQVDIKQNKIMEILTIMTTLFLPLTLITGWYGMNFEYMPELKWEYGYPTMILGSIIVVMICMKWFKKKKLL
ncbi:magnesium transporter CorA family protein [Cellulosilyticum ruminicola]|uniref:magnesium transporter CorA family protein n=1 Tax=Cellulosilyticum ruminicola TaxID=425254 RepID=UPI0006D27772|nr:CorA family divalent cation transporter [Cellulosilyticum ruminicola]